MIHLLAIFAAPLLQVIGFLALIIVVGCFLYWLSQQISPPFQKYVMIASGFVIFILVLWWMNLVFGLGLL